MDEGREIPRRVLLASEREGRRAWLEGLAAIVGELETTWSLRIGSALLAWWSHGVGCPARDGASDDLVVKVGFAWRIADLVGVDRNRLRHWLFARCVLESPDWPGLDDVARRLEPT